MLHDQIQITGWNVSEMSAHGRDVFGIRTTGVPSHQWTNCRESTANCAFPYYQQCGWQLIPYSMALNAFGVTRYYDAFCNIARMFDVIERRMGWWDRTRVHPTQHVNICGIHLSGGWFQNFNSLSLATLLIRVGNRYSEAQNLDAVLNMDTYGRSTLSAIHRFLNGYQHYTGTTSGWYEAFKNRPESELPGLLIRKSVVENLAQALWENAGSPANTSYWLEACQRLTPQAGNAA